MNGIDNTAKDSLKRSRENTIGGSSSDDTSKIARTDTNENKVYVGGLLCSTNESELTDYFERNIGCVKECIIVRGNGSRISRGFAFVTFAEAKSAEFALAQPQHILGCRPIKVSRVISKQAQDSSAGEKISSIGGNSRPSIKSNILFDEIALPVQNRIYFGPISVSLTTPELCRHFNQYGTVTNIHVFTSDETTVKSSFGFVDFRETSGVRRSFSDSFGSGQRIKGNTVHVALSRFFIELLLSQSKVFFFDAHLHCNFESLERHFMTYGRIFRALHLPNVNSVDRNSSRHKSFGFIDFVCDSVCVEAAVANRIQLINPPGQYIKVQKTLPIPLLAELLAVGDIQAETMKNAMQGGTLTPSDGIWTGIKCTFTTSSRVRIPTCLIPMLVGPGGKTISEICNDSRTRITIPRSSQSDVNVIILIEGASKEDVKSAQYLMQKLIKAHS